MTAKTLDQFDANFIASYGYHSVEEYRQESSPIRVAKYIRTPTLAISSLDDPVCCASGCPEDREAYASGKDNSAKLESSGIESVSGSGTGSSERSSGPGLVIIKTPYGGHLGFPVPARPPVKGAGSIPWGAWLQTTWTDRVIVDWFHAMSTRA